MCVNAERENFSRGRKKFKTHHLAGLIINSWFR